MGEGQTDWDVGMDMHTHLKQITDKGTVQYSTATQMGKAFEKQQTHVHAYRVTLPYV